ncbi:unnamed protein product [Triticum turgidum subsp. durum]|uniref:Uncharacterized protein n=1 Tax=Triticum turgidum subsp. durum TaxID=4567 RepID=A0A9R1AQR7_TRITD|nr:unnamed protein product [Triticum turgidum subsp. durum]
MEELELPCSFTSWCGSATWSTLPSANSMNMVSYLRGTMNMGVAAAATTSTNFVAALLMFTVPAAFLADSYVKRFYTVLIFAPLRFWVTSSSHPSTRPLASPAGVHRQRAT